MDIKRNREICHCTPNFDVRCCCWVNDKTFAKWSQKLSTTYYRITCEQDLYNKIEEGGINKIKQYIKKTCKLNDEEWGHIIELYNEDVETMNKD